jgi:hypothetical protein
LSLSRISMLETPLLLPVFIKIHQIIRLELSKLPRMICITLAMVQCNLAFCFSCIGEVPDSNLWSFSDGCHLDSNIYRALDGWMNMNYGPFLHPRLFNCVALSCSSNGHYLNKKLSVCIYLISSCDPNLVKIILFERLLHTKVT